MPLSTLLPFALIAVIGIVVFYAAYRADHHADREFDFANLVLSA